LSTSRTGAKIERRAARHYRLRGYRVLGTNVWSGGYELDLIVRRGGRLVFCEVKGKTGSGFGDPLEMVDEEKLRRLRRAAETWLARNPACGRLECRFEVVAIRPGRLERLAV
jgi:putative endonuclease